MKKTTKKEQNIQKKYRKDVYYEEIEDKSENSEE